MEFNLRKRKGTYTLKIALLYNRHHKTQRHEFGIPTGDSKLAQAITAGILKLLIDITSRGTDSPIYIFDEYGHTYHPDDIPELKSIIKSYNEDESKKAGSVSAKHRRSVPRIGSAD